ncbi:hypothetical protein GGI07_004333 [Coemansia sp. Benny D115]|nr:hypothetical protein GGI07_004333 [Coemansia sp. Benny D115]
MSEQQSQESKHDEYEATKLDEAEDKQAEYLEVEHEGAYIWKKHIYIRNLDMENLTKPCMLVMWIILYFLKIPMEAMEREDL